MGTSMNLDTKGQPFDLNLTLSAGQAFRWRHDKKCDWWSGVVRRQLIRIRQVGGNGRDVEFERVAGSVEDTASLLNSYFRLDDPIAEIYESLRRDKQMAELVAKYNGLRLLRQEPWECLISYVCSPRNTVERIERSMENLSAEWGEKLPVAHEIQYAFPTPTALATAGTDKLHEKIGGIPSLGERVSRTAKMVCSGDLNLEDLKKNPSCYAVIRKLEGLHGVGSKVADCVALFSLDKLEAFPIDTHIHAGMKKMYFSNGKNISDGDILLKASDLFGPYAGYAGQFIFHHRRTAADQVRAHSRTPQ